MFLVLPLSTDATADHKPWGTAALIAVNTAIAWWLGFPDFEPHDAFWGPAPEPPFVNRLVLIWDEFNPFQ